MKKNLFSVQNKSGFTLIEIMIVLTLLSLIGTFAVRNFMSKDQEGKQKATRILIDQIKTSLDDYYRTCGSYPSTAQGGLDALVKKPADDTCKDYDPSGYLKKVPKDAWNRDFLYLCDDGKKYVIKSLGRDNKEGGADFDKDISSED